MIVEVPKRILGADYVNHDDGSICIFRSLTHCAVPFNVPVRNLSLRKGGLEVARFENGQLIIWAGFRWDGCSPKKRAARLVFGTPDPPCTHLASKVHDLLYTFLLTPGFPLSRKQCDDCFYDIMRLSGFRFHGVYHFAVFLFGGRFASRVEGTEIIPL